MTSLLTEEQTKLIEKTKELIEFYPEEMILDFKVSEIDAFLKIIDLQNKVIEKCREQRDWGHDGWDPEVFDRELREIIESKQNHEK